MVEGLAPAAFGLIHQTTQEPLLKQLLRYVMADEARHVAFGVLSLQEFHVDLSNSEILEGQQFAFEAAIRMRDRTAGQEIWDRLRVSAKNAAKVMAQDPGRVDFQSLLLAKLFKTARNSDS